MAGRSAAFLVVSVLLHVAAAAALLSLAVPVKVRPKDPLVAVELVEVLAAEPVVEEKKAEPGGSPVKAPVRQAARRKAAPAPSPSPSPSLEGGGEVTTSDPHGAEQPTTATVTATATATGGEGGREGKVAIDRESVRSAVQKNARYPALARRRGLEGTVILRVRIGPGGSILETQVERSAGSALDAAAREAVSRSAPLPTPGQGWVRIPVAYKLDAP